MAIVTGREIEAGQAALEARVDMIEHASFVEPDGTVSISSELLARIRADGVVVGSALVGLAAKDGHPARVEKFVGQLATGLAHGTDAAPDPNPGKDPRRYR